MTIRVLPILLLAGLPALAPQIAKAQDLDLDEVFRCEVGEPADCLGARDTILNSCTSCHTFVPIVMQGFDEAGWHGLLTRHVENGRVNQLSEEQVAQLHAYLAGNFNGSLPPPELPPSLLETWTSY